MAAPTRRAAPVISTTLPSSGSLMSTSMNADASTDEATRELEARAALEAAIRAAGGWLEFERAMDLLLYSPALGYYTGGARKFGDGGDFITAPEISALFGQCIATQIAAVIAATEGDVLEIGAGSGTLALVLLEELARLGATPRRYRILELSLELRERQRDRLARLPPSLADRVEFLLEPPREAWRGAVIANEVLDALPVQRFRASGDGVALLGAALDGQGRLGWAERGPSASQAAEIARLRPSPEPWPDGYVSEWCPRLAPWLQAVTAPMTQGIALFADYGLPRREYYHPTRDRGTLRCHWRHRAHDDPWVHLGTQDITAWVDFTRVAEAADDAGLDVLGYTSQAAFLLGTGIEARIASSPNDVARARLVSEARQLLMPDGMGESFKVMALGRGIDEPLAGFRVRDLRERL